METDLLFEHLVRENGNPNVFASIFRFVPDGSFDSGVHVGMVKAYMDTALVILKDKNKGKCEKVKVIEEVQDKLLLTTDIYELEDLLQKLGENNIIF